MAGRASGLKGRCIPSTASPYSGKVAPIVQFLCGALAHKSGAETVYNWGSATEFCRKMDRYLPLSGSRIAAIVIQEFYMYPARGPASFSQPRRC